MQFFTLALLATVATALTTTPLKTLKERQYCGLPTTGCTATYNPPTAELCSDSTVSRQTAKTVRKQFEDGWLTLMDDRLPLAPTSATSMPAVLTALQLT